MLDLTIVDCDEVINATIEDGVKGDKGLSAYQVAVQEGFVGTIDEWLESLVGPPVPVAQELGDDPDLAVSQKLLKDSIDSMEQSNSEAVADKFDKSKVVGELGDRDDLVINQARVTLELNTLYRQIELLTAWSGHEIPKQPLYADFIGQRYAKDGKPCRFEDIFEFTRLSKAWQFEHGKLEDYEVNEPRFSGKGLLIEHSTTNYAIRTKTPTTETWCQASSKFSSRYIEINGGGLFTAKNSRDESNNWGIYRSHNTTNKDKVKYTGFGVHSHIGKDTLQVSSSNPRSYAMLNFITKEHSTVGSQTVGSYLLGDVFLGEFNTLAAVAESATGGIDDSITYFGIFAVDSLTYSPIPTENAPVTRLPETLTVLTESNFIIEADEGIQVNGNEITGFGYIRKLEVK